MISDLSVVDRVRFRGESWTPELRRFAESAMQTAVGRFTRRIAGVLLTLRDLNGPKGGVDQRCRIELKLVRRPGLVVEATSDNEYAAIAKASERARRKLVRLLRRPASLARQAR